MRARIVLALQLLLLTTIPAVAQDDPCASSQTRDLKFSDFTESLSETISADTSVRPICCLPTVKPALTIVSGDSGMSTI